MEPKSTIFWYYTCRHRKNREDLERCVCTEQTRNPRITATFGFLVPLLQMPESESCETFSWKRKSKNSSTNKNPPYKKRSCAQLQKKIAVPSPPVFGFENSADVRSSVTHKKDAFLLRIRVRIDINLILIIVDSAALGPPYFQGIPATRAPCFLPS